MSNQRKSAWTNWNPGIGPRRGGITFKMPRHWNLKPWVCDECGAAAYFASPSLKDGYRCEKCNTFTTFHRRRVFSLSLGDWLDREIPVEWLADMLDVIRRCDQLQWILCTNRPEQWQIRIDKLTTWDEPLHTRPQLACWLEAWRMGKAPANICILASVENQATADERIPHLLNIPAAIRGISLEPMLGPVKLPTNNWCDCVSLSGKAHSTTCQRQYMAPGIDWVIVGGESGPKARPCNVEWIRSIVNQCQSAGTACFVKQLGSYPLQTLPANAAGWVNSGVWLKHRSGADPAEWPLEIQVRQFPKGML